MSHELSIKTEELEELRSETMRQSFHASRVELKPDRTEYVDEGYSIYTAVPKKTDYGRMHHSMSYITSDTRCSCPSMRSQLVGQLIEDLFDRIHNTADDDLKRLCKELAPVNSRDITFETKAKITNYLLMAISKELVRSIGDADAKTDTEVCMVHGFIVELPEIVTKAFIFKVTNVDNFLLMVVVEKPLTRNTRLIND